MEPPQPPTPQQLEILILLAHGARCEQVSQELCLANTTVYKHFLNLRARLGAKTLTEAVFFAIARGYLAVDGRAERAYVPAPFKEVEEYGLDPLADVMTSPSAPTTPPPSSAT